jgi:AraC-like DNA-binding protein
LAREALVHQNLSVTEAAYVAGYSNPANFATAFRKYFGAAPSAYRAQR